jgi:hypothetical protein
MAMLKGCTFPECDTLTLSEYCLEHELFIRAEIEASEAQRPEKCEVKRDVVGLGQATG